MVIESMNIIMMGRVFTATKKTGNIVSVKNLKTVGILILKPSATSESNKYCRASNRWNILCGFTLSLLVLTLAACHKNDIVPN